MFGASDPQRRIGLAVLRVIVGVVFLMHGWQKFSVMGIGGVTGFFTQVGAPLPAISAYLITFLEIFGGSALILGFLTRIVALGFVLDMAGAIALVHWKNGFFVENGGVELVLTLLAAAVAFAIAGPGAASIDELIAKRRASRP